MKDRIEAKCEETVTKKFPQLMKDIKPQIQRGHNL